MVRLLAAAVALLLLAPAAVSAHSGNPNFESIVTRVEPPGLQVEVLNRDDRLALRAPAGREVEIPGYVGEPYGRIRADGRVQVNVASEAYWINQERDGRVAVPQGAGKDAVPRWETLDRTGRLEWHDHRFHYMGEGTPPQVRDPGVRTKVQDWSVPVVVDGRPGTIAGTLYWTPRAGGGMPAGAVAGLAALVLVSLAAVVVSRRRGRRRRRGAGGAAERAAGAGAAEDAGERIPAEAGTGAREAW